LTIKIDENDDKIKDEIIQVTKDATDKIVEMRSIEGQKIAHDLLVRIEKIEDKIKEISKKSTGLIEEYVVKLEKKNKRNIKNRRSRQIETCTRSCNIC